MPRSHAERSLIKAIALRVLAGDLEKALHLNAQQGGHEVTEIHHLARNPNGMGEYLVKFKYKNPQGQDQHGVRRYMLHDKVMQQAYLHDQHTESGKAPKVKYHGFGEQDDPGNAIVEAGIGSHHLPSMARPTTTFEDDAGNTRHRLNLTVKVPARTEERKRGLIDRLMGRKPKTVYHGSGVAFHELAGPGLEIHRVGGLGEDRHLYKIHDPHSKRTFSAVFHQDALNEDIAKQNDWNWTDHQRFDLSQPASESAPKKERKKKAPAASPAEAHAAEETPAQKEKGRKRKAAPAEEAVLPGLE